MKLKSKLLATIVILVITLTLSLSVMFYFLMGSTAKEEFHKRGLSNTLSLAANGKLGVMMNDTSQLGPLMSSAAKEDPEVVSIYFYDPQLKVISGYGEQFELLNEDDSKDENNFCEVKNTNNESVALFRTSIFAREGDKETIGIVQIGVSLKNLYSSINNSILWSVIVCVLFSVGAFLISKFYLEKKITLPIEQSAEMMEELRHGHLGVRMNYESNDEIGMLAKHMNEFADVLQTNVIGTMKKISKGDLTSTIEMKDAKDEINPALHQTISSLKGFIDGMNTMSREHDKGDFDIAISTEKFEGSYKTMAEGLNNMVHGHINVYKKTMACVEEFGKGNFEATLEQFPGKKAFINTTIEQVRSNIKNLVVDVHTLANAALAGELQIRADATKHQGDFRKIVEGVNNTLDSVTLPVKEGSDVLQKMAIGDLTVRVQGKYKGDLAMIMNAINTVGDSLDNALTEVSSVVQATASASNEISSSSDEMANGAQLQTEQTTEVALAVEEMTHTIQQNSKNASQAAETAKLAKDSAENGGKVVDETIKGMKRIAEVVKKSAVTVQELGKSSHQIGEIISVIDDIADQTNLLALNAAIEAARAGEQGRGFAVVADEVRKLAERTTKATKEIATMIKKIQYDTIGAVQSMEEGTKEVDAGIKLADKAGDSLRDIVNVSQKVTEMVTQIAAASEQQTSASEQISKNIESISTVTSETAGSTQQIAHSTEDMSRMTENLQRLINNFKLSSEVQQSSGFRNRRKEEKTNLAVKPNGTIVRH